MTKAMIKFPWFNIAAWILVFLAAGLDESGAVDIGPLSSAYCEVTLLGAEASISEARSRAAELLKKRGEPLEEELTNPLPVNVERRHPEQWSVWGVPDRVKLFKSNGVVFRHFVPDKPTQDAIKKTGLLLSGYLPYVEVAPGVYKKTYFDLSGVFLTLDGVAPDHVGVKAQGQTQFYYLDLTVPDSVPVLEIEKGRIYLIPLRENFREWVREDYLKYKAGQKVASPDLLRTFRRIDRQGGLPTTLGAVPIKIISAGKDF